MSGKITQFLSDPLGPGVCHECNFCPTPAVPPVQTCVTAGCNTPPRYGWTLVPPTKCGCIPFVGNYADYDLTGIQTSGTIYQTQECAWTGPAGSYGGRFLASPGCQVQGPYNYGDLTAVLVFQSPGFASMAILGVGGPGWPGISVGSGSTTPMTFTSCWTFPLFFNNRVCMAGTTALANGHIALTPCP